MELIKEKSRERKRKDRVKISAEDELGPPPSVEGLADLTLDYIETNIRTHNVMKEAENVLMREQTKTDNLVIGKEDLEAIQTKEVEHKILTPPEEPTIVTTIDDNKEENILPSAPVLEESTLPVEQLYTFHNVISDSSQAVEEVYEVHAVSLEVAEQLFCGNEISQVRAMSEKEAMLVLNSTITTPDHPLVDLLTSFRQSLIAMERERINISRSYIEEEKFRNSLWKVEKKEVKVREKCGCGKDMGFRAVYEHATLLRDKLPLARSKLGEFTRNIMDTFCHHQHSALLAHQQIEEYIYETLHSTNSQIRVCLGLILEALRRSDSGPPVLADALERWATALVSNLTSHGHMSDLLFVWHHLFRQNRSVRWAIGVMRVCAQDLVESARVVALLELLLTHSTTTDTALECTEEGEIDLWEELDTHGRGCAVAGGMLRERDLLAAVCSLPLSQLLARLALLRHQNWEDADEYSWGDATGLGVLKAASGARVLLAALRPPPRYPRLAAALASLAALALAGLADLHHHSQSNYLPDLVHKIAAELEEAFATGWNIVTLAQVHLDKLPFSILMQRTARRYYDALSSNIHADLPIVLEGAEHVIVPAHLGCGGKIKALAQLAIDRCNDYELAKIILEFLLQVAFAHKSSLCPHKCADIARCVLSRVLLIHPYLYCEAIYTFGRFRIGEEVEASDIEYLSPANWVPGPQEITAVLNSLWQSSPVLLPKLLLALDYTPHSGVPLESQLAIVSFLSAHCGTATHTPPWSWQVARRLRLHRHHRGPSSPSPPAPGPCPEPSHLFGDFVAVLATDWGHSIPLICASGVGALLRLARAGLVRESVHALGAVLRVMAASPESIAHTAQFGSLCTVLAEAGPGLVQRALGRGGPRGATLLAAQLRAQLRSHPPSDENILWLFSAWFQFCRNHSSLLEMALVCLYDVTSLDAHMDLSLQDATAALTSAGEWGEWGAVRVQTLRAAHRAHAQAWAALLCELQAQRRAGKRTHVDNALQSIGAEFRSEELVIHKCTAAILATSISNPSHLLLWRLFFYLYLQRPSDIESPSPVIGPLFFDGLIKSRVLVQLKKKLSETITYHRNEVDRLRSGSIKSSDSSDKINTEKRRIKSSSTEKSSSSESIKDSIHLFPSMTLADLTDTQIVSISDELSSDEEESKMTDRKESEKETLDSIVDSLLLATYHEGAMKACREYLRCLEDGERTMLLPHHTDISLFIPLQALNEAWKLYLNTLIPPSSCYEDDGNSDQKRRLIPPPPLSPLQRLLNRLKKYGRRNKRSPFGIILRPPSINLPTNSQALIKFSDQTLKDMVKISIAWEGECDSVLALDAALWPLVSALRVRTAFAPVVRACAHCGGAITLLVPGEEWVLSSEKSRSVRENRAAALTALRRLAATRARPAALHAQLLAIARAVQDADTAASAARAAWQCAGHASLQRCAHASSAVAELFSILVQKYISHDGPRCVALVEQCWGRGQLSATQQSAAAALVAPQRLAAKHAPPLYRAVLRRSAPPHAVFSCLSKFEIPKWAANADFTLKREMLNIIFEAFEEIGPTPSPEYDVLIELLCVHATALVCSRLLHGAVVRAAESALPPRAASSLLAAAAALLPELSSHEIRSTLSGMEAAYSTAARADAAHAQSSLVRCAAAALARALLSERHASEHVAWLVWCSCYHSWELWMDSMHSKNEHKALDDIYTIFMESLTDICNIVPDGAARLLQEVFSWTAARPLAALVALVSHLARLPWRSCQWLHARCMPALLQMCKEDETIRSFCCDVLSNITTEGWLVGVASDQVAPHLAVILYLCIEYTMHPQILEAWSHLPWRRLPQVALEPALEQFFLKYHGDPLHYHELPQFRVVVCASEMGSAEAPRASEKRSALVAAWVRAVVAPGTPPARAAAATDAILDLISHIYGSPCEQPDEVEDEMVDLLRLVITIMCVDSAATTSLPSWERWSAEAAHARLVLRALPALSGRAAFALLAACALRGYLLSPDASWHWVERQWRRCGEAPLLPLLPLLPQYALSLSPSLSPSRALSVAVAPPCVALLARPPHFTSSEPEVALWVCRCTRAVIEERSANREGYEQGQEVVTLLSRWAAETSRSILQTLSIMRSDDKPTARIRLLCRFSMCLLSPSEAAVKAYESSLSVFPELVTLPRSLYLPQLPRLAVQLFPAFQNYFSYEIEMVSNS